MNHAKCQSMQVLRLSTHFFEVVQNGLRELLTAITTLTWLPRTQSSSFATTFPAGRLIGEGARESDLASTPDYGKSIKLHSGEDSWFIPLETAA